MCFNSDCFIYWVKIWAIFFTNSTEFKYIFTDWEKSALQSVPYIIPSHLIEWILQIFHQGTQNQRPIALCTLKGKYLVLKTTPLVQCNFKSNTLKIITTLSGVTVTCLTKNCVFICLYICVCVYTYVYSSLQNYVHQDTWSLKPGLHLKVNITNGPDTHSYPLKYNKILYF